jgi:predicted ABC-type transport system involved in lysophospholipase L1 biosynthesis ATPase subunit
VSVSAISPQTVGKVFDERDAHRVRVLTAIDLNVSDGEFLCIIGPSGCGETTLVGPGCEPCRSTSQSDAPVAPHQDARTA